MSPNQRDALPIYICTTSSETVLNGPMQKRKKEWIQFKKWQLPSDSLHDNSLQDEWLQFVNDSFLRYKYE